MKKMICLVIVFTIALLGFTGCAKENNGITVGIIQYGSHDSLDNCYEGIYDALSQIEGITIDLQNGNFESTTCDAIAKNMASKNYDLIIAIATPAATSAYAACMNTNIPVIFCAVNDPVGAGIVDTLDIPGGLCSGTSDILDFDAQLKLITSLQPNVKRIGILYTTSEANSVSNLARFTEVAKAYDVEVVSQGVQTAADIPQAAASLCSKVDCINNFTDNNVVNNLTILLEQANIYKIPVYGSEIEQVEKGCLASVSIDYVELGKVTGKMAIDVLNGEDTTTMAVKTISDATPIINMEVATELEISIPSEYANADFITE